MRDVFRYVSSAMLAMLTVLLAMSALSWLGSFWGRSAGIGELIVIALPLGLVAGWLLSRRMRAHQTRAAAGTNQ
jgi:hypothetical protein